MPVLFPPGLSQGRSSFGEKPAQLVTFEWQLRYGQVSMWSACGLSQQDKGSVSVIGFDGYPVKSVSKSSVIKENRDRIENHLRSYEI
ncbi:hypothetical protein PoB_000017100 [Plakobranchus ocellatus]|uniref:Uncharacterized protein n=1 Tax=Plakobranchus ocellatus TaxID=259542 RepID=A0AAV3XR10_9GAST|nr:hypothetical protein PoB_000017100 [Plakobranchus ocellatus]